MLEDRNAQMIDAYGSPYGDFDCIAELNESFAKDTLWGRDTYYGIIYASKWILPLKGNTKKQTVALSFVKVRDDEIRPEDKAKLEAIYVFYAKYQRFPPKGFDVVKEMAGEVAAFKEQMKQKPVSEIIAPFSEGAAGAVWTQESDSGSYDEDDDF